MIASDRQRRHPRVPSDLSCTFRPRGAKRSQPGRIRTVAREGLGIRVADVFSLDSREGEMISVSMTIDGSALELEGKVVWISTSESSPFHLGVHFDPETVRGASSFSSWVERAFRRHRSDSELLGGELAWQRQVSLRELQAALDKQSRDGGYLTDLLPFGDPDEADE